MPSFDGARCAEPGVDPELFFDPNCVDAAVDLCWRCPARAECRAWATEHQVDGVWGATTASERRFGERRRRGRPPRRRSASPAAIAKRAERARRAAAAA